MTAPQKLEKIGRYQVLERVGKGGMGVLYRGFDPVLDREVAIKLMHADFSEDTEQMRPRFYREARAAAKLQHRNIVTIFEFAEESNVPYIVMEFLRGTPLGARLNAQPPLTLDDKLNVIAQLCDGLSYAHDQGVVHRDVKPDNIFLLEDGSVKLLDFGIAKLTSSTLTRQGDVLGSASYMSPEQVGGSEAVDGRADIFSSGVVLYEMLCGRKPFEGDSPTAVIVKILKDEPTPIETYAQGLPPQVVAAVVKALVKDPAERYQTADAFGRELQSIRKGLHPSASKAQMDETRFASTQVMKALHEDLRKAREGGGRAANETQAGVTRAVATPEPPPPAAADRKWLVPAIAGGVLVVGIGAFALYSGRGTSEAQRPIAAPGETQVAANAPPSAAPAAPVVAPVGSAAAPGANTTTAAPADPPPPAAPAGSPAASRPTPGMARPGPEGKRPTATAPPAAAPTPAPAPAPAPPPAASGAAMVSVTLNGNYPFEVLDGSRSISAAAMSHEFRQPAGKSLQIRASQYFLDRTIRVEGSANEPFEFTAPGLAKLDIRSPQETCDIVIAGKKLGNPPLVQEVAAGSYKVDLVCGTDVVKTQYTTVRAGSTSMVPLR